MSDGSSLVTQGGDITLNANATATTGSLINLDNVINANGGNIALSAVSSTPVTGSTFLIQGNTNGGTTIKTSGSGSISVLGDAHNVSATAGSVWGMEVRKMNFQTENGDITLHGIGGYNTTNARGIALDNATATSFLSASGTITFIDEKPSNAAAGWTGYRGLYFGNTITIGADGNLVPSSTSNVVIQADALLFTTPTSNINSTGTVVIEPLGASFTSGVSTANLAMNGIGNLRIGKVGNTAAIGLDRALTVAGHVTVYGGNVNGAYGISLGNGYTLTVDNSGNSSVLSGVISGTDVSLSKLGAGVLTLTGNNTYTGGTSIDTVSTLVVGNAATSGALGTGAINNNGVLSFKRSDAITVADVISGTGIVKQEGAGTLTLSGTNAYEGGTQVNAGTLAISTDRNVGAVPSTLTLTTCC